ncbi:hypothetical protein CGC50_06410 [Capnocytophaga gingivalis]|jgi:hypothetical protein|uniref:Metallo-beta-lactamase domain-containing protein n=1 Tax=Capnocytophaga gingivalis TaxID=1017 RepID=A0A250FP26_9FLAO|nr:hypothetical protein [Capnocytophaga gingivalis]ATA86824.1 hypothetical protein CGC50_06410 [Capnocytophaga gingivalis]
MIQRIFHPIGQGAFYSERHENHNIVYDCGSMCVSKSKKVVSQSFSKEDVIDILFISHFDYDHISLIEDLKTTVKEIRNVVIPLLHNNEKILLSNIFKALGENNLATLVKEPKEFFGAETRIIRVEPSSEEKINEGTRSIFLNDANQKLQISSGTLIAIEKNSDWIFIPFNYEYKDRSKKFLDKLKKNGIDINKLENVPDDYTEYRKIIKKTYEEVGDINENSMFLYSGPTINKKNFYYTYLYRPNKHYCYFYFHPFHNIKQDRVACLYTGDGDLNIVDGEKTVIEKIYERYWNLIGTIQIPHHGSLYSFNNKILKDNVFICPFSVGKNNLHGHPSGKVISEILSHKSYPIYVTEDVDSIFIEIIEKKIKSNTLVH